VSPEPEVTFDQLNLHPDLLKGIHTLGFRRPTPIQAEAIPPIIEGRDMIGCAQTGTGKTAAFILPILHKLMLKENTGHVRALVIAPTRELAVQSKEHLDALSLYTHITGEAIFGGAPMQHQITALKKGVDILSATPGRLLDHVYSGRINFVDLSVLVLDEADRMLDMGFLPDIHNILRLLPPNNQRLMFSATMPPEIFDLAKEILNDPVIIEVARQSTAAAGIRHAVYPIPAPKKTELLIELLRDMDMRSVLVFTRTKISADRVARELDRTGIRVSSLHGDHSQEKRMRALEKFRQGRSRVMVATDVAARGIDVKGISHVINFDVPNNPEDYIHRIGRTARAETMGDAFTLVDKREEPMIKEIEQLLGHALPRVKVPKFSYSPSSSKPARGSGRPSGSASGRGRGPQKTSSGSRGQHASGARKRSGQRSR